MGCATRNPTSLERTGVAAYRRGHYREAADELETARRVLDERGNHGLDYARVLQDLAEVYRVLGRSADAEPLVREALAIRERLLPAGDPEIGRTLSNLGLVLTARHKYGDAEDACRRAIANLEAALGPQHVDVATPLGNLAAVLVHLRRCAEAEAVGRRSLAIREHNLPPTHPDVGRGLSAVAGAIGCDPARYAEAEQYHARAVKSFEMGLGEDHPQVALALGGWARDAAAAGRLEAAEELCARSVRIERIRLPPGSSETEAVRRCLSEARPRASVAQ